MNFRVIISLVMLYMQSVSCFIKPVNPVRNWVINKFIPANNKVEDWWYNPIIHTFGNVGIGGSVHAALAPLVTKMIDRKAYNGRDVRQEFCDIIVNNIEQDSLFAIDFACGVGISSNALYKSIDGKNIEKKLVYALDSSPQMISAAEKRGNPNIKYRESNVSINEYMMYNNCVDLITCLYLLHEVPSEGRKWVFKNAHSLLKTGGVFAIADVSSYYRASTGMLIGEPYLLEYQKTVNDTIDDYIRSGKFRVIRIPEVPYNPRSSNFQEWIPGHVMVTLLEKI